MSEEYGPDFITIVDEDGNNIELELTDELEHNGCRYMSFFPAVEEGADEESEDYGLVILKVIEEDGEELLSTLDSDASFFNPHFVIRDAGSVSGLQASRLPPAVGSWKQ